MLMEQIIEFELRVPGPPGRTCTHENGYFHEEEKSSSRSSLIAKILQEAMYLTSPYRGQITKFNPKCKLLNLFWT